MEQEKKNRRVQYGMIVLVAAAVLLAADQVIKHYVLVLLKPIGTVTLIDGLLEFCYVENTGAAFGFFRDQIWFVGTITVITFLAILFLLFWYRSHTALTYIVSALVMAGGIGNLLDRFFYGFVVDFIHVLFFDYIFNFADCCITVGAGLLVLHVLLLTYREKKAAQAAVPAADSDEKLAEPPQDQKDE